MHGVQRKATHSLSLETLLEGQEAFYVSEFIVHHTLIYLMPQSSLMRENMSVSFIYVDVGKIRQCEALKNI